MTDHIPHSRCRRHHSGGGLVEVMIAVLVFSLGLLGTAATQLQARKNLFDAAQRSRATALAADIIARMRANPQQLAAYETSNLGDPARPPVPPSPDCQLVACSPAELASWDLYDWHSLLIGRSELVTRAGVSSAAGGLVEPRACITQAGGQVRVQLTWHGRGAAPDVGGTSCGGGAAPTAAPGHMLLQLTTYIGQWP